MNEVLCEKFHDAQLPNINWTDDSQTDIHEAAVPGVQRCEYTRPLFEYQIGKLYVSHTYYVILALM